MANIGDTNVPAITWGDTGPVAPTGPAILAGVQADYNIAFNVTFNWSSGLSTPQGQLAASTAAVINDKNQYLIYYVNQIDPAFSGGRMQDAIARIYFLTRNPAEPTVVQATCTGLEGVSIPAGSIARAESGLLYTSTEDAVIPAIGTINISFSCNTVGPVPCAAGSLNQIYRTIPGWDTITNASDGVLGRDTESRQDFEVRRAASVAANSRGSLSAIQGAVLAVEDVLDAYVTENPLGVPTVIGGVNLVAHSLYVAAVGGTDQAVADAIWAKKAPGCNYNGNTTKTVQDLNGSYNPPYPSYSVTFERPTELAILFRVRIVNSIQVPADADVQVQDAIILAFSGSDGTARARIGSTLYSTRYIPAIVALGAWAQVISIRVNSNNDANAHFTASIAGTNMTVTAVASGTLVVDDTVSGTGVVVGTRIVSQTSGPAGGTGVYVVTNTQTVASTAMVSALADADQVAVNIDQAPTINAGNIIVTFV